MQIRYVEIVTKEVDAVCSAYAAANGVQFGKPDAGLGNARTAALLGVGLVGVRPPMHEKEEPVVRPYWLVKNSFRKVPYSVTENKNGLRVPAQSLIDETG